MDTTLPQRGRLARASALLLMNPSCRVRLGDYNRMRAQHIHDQGNPLLLERQRDTVIAGRHAMVIEIADAVAVTLSGQPPIALPAGRYLYCGSAKGPAGLKARLSRHMRRGKSLRWHVDQLTEQGSVVGSWVFPGGDECGLVQMCSHLPMPIAGFGSSDCATCRSHLLFWPNGVALRWLGAGIEAARP